MDKSLLQMKRRLAERIEAVRKQNGPRSQRQFARDLGVFQQNVNRYENGTKPHIDFLFLIATKEGINVDWIVCGRGKMKAARA